MKPIVFTKHALAVIGERRISPEWILRTVGSPQWRETDPVDPAGSRLFGVIQNEPIDIYVSLVETATEIRIVSAFLDRRARPK